jgi:hypothetical protein
MAAVVGVLAFLLLVLVVLVVALLVVLGQVRHRELMGWAGVLAVFMMPLA